MQVVVDDGVAAEKQRVMNPTLLVGGEYRPLGAMSECLSVDDIEQVLVRTSNTETSTTIIVSARFNQPNN